MIVWMGFIRLVSYVLIIMASTTIIKLGKGKWLAMGNIVAASVLMLNAVSQIHGVTMTNIGFQYWAINIGICFWAIMAVIQMSKS